MFGLTSDVGLVPPSCHCGKFCLHWEDPGVKEIRWQNLIIIGLLIIAELFIFFVFLKNVVLLYLHPGTLSTVPWHHNVVTNCIGNTLSQDTVANSSKKM